MSKDRSLVDVRHITATGFNMVKQFSDKCDKAVSSSQIWTEYSIPSKILITKDQFKELATLNGEPDAQFTGKEHFRSKQGFMFEIQVEGVKVAIRK